MAAKVFISYTRADEPYKDMLLKHLSLLKRRGLIDLWHDRRIDAGEDFTQKIDGELEKSDIVVLLISADFIASNYCYSHELESAMRLHELGLVKVVPVIARACDWTKASFGKLKVLPSDGKEITAWSNQDDAFRDVALGIRKLVEQVQSERENEPHASIAKLRPRPLRHVIAAAFVAACLAGLVYWQSGKDPTKPEPAPPASLLSEQRPNSPKATDSTRSMAPDAPVGTGRPGAGSETPATPTVLIRDGNGQPRGGSVSALASRDTAKPGTPAPADSAETLDTAFVPEGVIVITEITATAAPGQAWEPGNDLAPLPDVLLCFRQTANGREICRPNWFGLASARTQAHDDASHAVDLFADMKHWNETFWLTLRDQDNPGRKLMGQGECHFGKPCAVIWAGDGKTPIAAVLVLPGLQSSEAIRTRYLRRCVDGSNALAQQWETLAAFANPGDVTKPDASRVSYETLARTFMAAADIEITGGMLKAAVDAGKGQGRLAHVTDTFRATLLRAEADADGQSPAATSSAVNRRSTLLRQRLADMGLDRLIAAGCR